MADDFLERGVRRVHCAPVQREAGRVVAAELLPHERTTQTHNKENSRKNPGQAGGGRGTRRDLFCFPKTRHRVHDTTHGMLKQKGKHTASFSWTKRKLRRDQTEERKKPGEEAFARMKPEKEALLQYIEKIIPRGGRVSWLHDAKKVKTTAETPGYCNHIELRSLFIQN